MPDYVAILSLNQQQQSRTMAISGIKVLHMSLKTLVWIGKASFISSWKLSQSTESQTKPINFSLYLIPSIMFTKPCHGSTISNPSSFFVSFSCTIQALTSRMVEPAFITTVEDLRSSSTWLWVHTVNLVIKIRDGWNLLFLCVNSVPTWCQFCRIIGWMGAWRSTSPTP